MVTRQNRNKGQQLSTVLSGTSTLCMLRAAGFFQNYLFKKKIFRNTIRVSISLDPDQDRHFVSPDLGPNCLTADFFFKINYFKKLFQEHNQSVKQFGSRSGPTFCRS